MYIIKVTSGNRMSFLTPLTRRQAYNVGTFLLIDNDGNVRAAGRKRDCVAAQSKLEGK
jgi:hypothetical protein